jgi:hypothetical protein
MVSQLTTYTTGLTHHTRPTTSNHVAYAPTLCTSGRTYVHHTVSVTVVGKRNLLRNNTFGYALRSSESCCSTVHYTIHPCMVPVCIHHVVDPSWYMHRNVLCYNMIQIDEYPYVST